MFAMAIENNFPGTDFAKFTLNNKGVLQSLTSLS
jgi:hypothetical protein